MGAARGLAVCGAIGLAACLCSTARGAEEARRGGTTTGWYQISGPYTHSNLAVYLLLGFREPGAEEILSLQEALARKLVVVYETGNVRQLAVANRSPKASVYIQAGEIVKGGKQDRVISKGLILPPNSGKVPIGSFCVEASRWRRRGGEPADRFNSATKTLVTREQKLAVRYYADQQAVWRNVAKAREKLRGALGCSTGATPASRGRQLADFVRQSVARSRVGARRGAWAESSLQLTLERGPVREAVAKYVEHLEPLAKKHPDAVGYAFAVNGQLSSADIYASPTLFEKMWPKLLVAASTEALAEYEKGKLFEHPSGYDVEIWLTKAEIGTAAREAAQSPGDELSRGKAKRTLLFETPDATRACGWIHRCYIRRD